MKCIILYFSQSGNTKKIARAIHKGMRPLLERCDLIPIERADPRDISAYDLFGIGSPTRSGPPPHLRRFIQAIRDSPAKHAFIFYTHGVLFRRFLPATVRLLAKRGFTVIGARNWYGSVHHPLFPTPYLTDGHPDEIDLAEAEDFGRGLPEISRRILSGKHSLFRPSRLCPATNDEKDRP